jgi:hypothetical protein
MTSQPREIGGILTSYETQKNTALLSQHYRCPHCGVRHPNLVVMKTVETNESNQINEKNDMKLPIKGFQSQNSLTSSLETKFSGLSTTRNTKISLKKVKRKLQQKRFENQISLIFERLNTKEVEKSNLLARI